MKATKSYTLTAAALGLMALSTPVSAATTDSSIANAVKNSYTYRTYLKDDEVKVLVNDGVVTLLGTVAEESRKSLAGETVANLPDVKSVDNQLHVDDESSPDLWLLTKVKTTLLFHGNVNVTTTVDVKDGVVTLSGEADNQAQKDLTGAYAMDIGGVKSVINEMSLSRATGGQSGKTPAARTLGGDATGDRWMGDKIDDASITALVKTTLFSHRSTSVLQTAVETRDGVVSLHGEVGSDTEIDKATKLAGDIKGVRSVDNKMTVRTKVTVN